MRREALNHDPDEDPYDPWPDVKLRRGDEDEVYPEGQTSLVSHLIGVKDEKIRMLPDLSERKAQTPSLTQTPSLPQKMRPLQPPTNADDGTNALPPLAPSELTQSPNLQTPQPQTAPTTTPAMNPIAPPGIDPMSVMLDENDPTVRPRNAPSRAQAAAEDGSSEPVEMTDALTEMEERQHRFEEWEQKNRPKRERPKVTSTYPEEDRRRIHEETADDEHVRGPVSRRHLRDHGFGITLDPSHEIPDEDLRRIHERGHSKKQSSKTARRDYSLQEKQALIDEEGEATNASKLDLKGTHYEPADDVYTIVGPLFGL